MTLRFDKDTHVYCDLDTGRVLPNITTMLERTGWVDTRWYTEEARDRGTLVHELTAAYDLKALTFADIPPHVQGFLGGYYDVVSKVKPQWTRIEMPMGHPAGWAGTPDRVGRVFKQPTVLEIKSGRKQKSHPIQTALQALLVAQKHKVPASQWARLALYLRADGTYEIEQHLSPRDFQEAGDILAVCVE